MAHKILPIDREEIPEYCRQLIHRSNARLFTMVGNDEREIHGNFVLYYTFLIDGSKDLITLKASVPENDPCFPSIASQFPAANWYEREVRDLLGLVPLHHPDPRPLVLHGDWPEGLYPLRKEFSADLKPPRVESRETFMEYEGEGITQIPVGPIHAGIIEPGHFRFGAMGDTILHLDARLFYTHRGLEKSSEGKSVQHALLIAERICGVCSLSHAVSFAQAVEALAQAEVPVRGLYLRSLFLELERLYNHIGDIGNLCAGIGFSFGTSQGAIMKERMMQLNEKLTGHRFLRGMISLGGVKQDLSEEDRKGTLATLENIETQFRRLMDILLNHDIVIDRMKTTGILTKEMADSIQVVGPAARASGRNIDVRRDLPYAAYREVDFDVPIYDKGDVWCRMKVRMDEVFQSLGIIGQLLENLPSGPIQREIGSLTPYQWAVGWTESPRGENVHWVMAGENNTVYRYRIKSASYSNWPAVPLTVPGNIVPDFPLINKSFELCYACCDR
ncbi:NADH-quinone oxidoreductase subunit C [Microaerobacter geothermalis]|uniref:hydrogenase large subunit n=1 Tax=Microaerobacter geothermalis TaxID=674972 RepID=UPI001F38390D|nr:NADH-quinone oxidoreductase subunit C [Microaerobacter geothermalis]MCF6093064.1 NADH-quinone oxidoreductase subunit C [Microaerobacter geothermalis]